MPRRVVHVTLRCRADEGESLRHSAGPAARLWALELRSAIRCAQSPTTRRFVMNAGNTMPRTVFWFQPEKPFSRAAPLMFLHRISGLPVVASDGHVVGVATEGDFPRRAKFDTRRRRPRGLHFLVAPGGL